MYGESARAHVIFCCLLAEISVSFCLGYFPLWFDIELYLAGWKALLAYLLLVVSQAPVMILLACEESLIVSYVISI